MTSRGDEGGGTVIPLHRAQDTSAEMGEWEGGYWRKNKAGRTVYYIRKRIDGRLYEVSYPTRKTV